MKKKIIMALLVGSLVAAPVSCFAADTSAETTADTKAAEETEEEDTEEAADETSEDTKELKTVGEETDDAVSFKLKNATTKKITGLAIKASEDTEFPENMMAADDSFALKEKKMVFFTKAKKDSAENTEDASKDQASTYDLHITFEDQTTADVHGVALEDLVTLVIREKNGIVYGTYQKQSDKEKASTYDAEKAIADQAAADAAAQAQAEADAAAAQQSQSSDYSYDYSDDYSYDYGADDYSGTEDYSGGDNGGDGCLDDGLLG